MGKVRRSLNCSTQTVTGMAADGEADGRRRTNKKRKMKMKKLMFALVAAGAAAVMGDAIESANIVGYQGVSKGSVAQPMFGFTFVPVDGATSNKLGDVAVNGMRGGTDFIQVINPTTLAQDAQYTYYSAAQAENAARTSAEELVEEGEYDTFEEAYADEYPRFAARIGWWTGTVGSSSRADDVYVAVGSGFLGLGNASRPMTFNCAGEAPTTAKSYSSGAVAQPIVANFLPTRFYLSDMTVTGMRGGTDFIQVINPTTLAQDAQYTYYSAAQAENAARTSAEELVEEGEYDTFEEAYADEYPRFAARIGWWTGTVGSSSRADSVIVEAGDAFLVLGSASRPLTFNFKSVLDLTPIAD